MNVSPRGKWLALALATALGITLAIKSGKCDHPVADEETPTKNEDALVPAPDGLLADIIMTTPNASWAKLQRGIGGAVGILPASAGGIVCAITGLDPFIAGEIDGTLPAFGVIAADPVAGDSGAGERGVNGWVIAMKITDLRKARAVLVDGDTARYSARDAGGMTELVAKGQGNAPPVAVAFSPNGYLLIARRSEDLARLSPYVTRTLPKRPLPSEGAIVLDVPKDAIGSVVKPKLDGLWSAAKGFLLGEDERMRREHAGRAPDFGDPKAIVAAADAWVTKRIGVVGDLEKLRITADLADDGITVLATMTPSAGRGPAATWTNGMKVGDAAPLATMPANAAAALLLRDGEEERAEQAREIEKTITSSLGSRLAEGDAKKLHDIVEDVTKARGDVLTSSLVWDDPQGIALRGPTRDGEAATRAIKGAIELAKQDPFKEIFRVKDVTSTSEELGGAGKVTLATIVRDTAKDPRSERDLHNRESRDGGAPKPAVKPPPSADLSFAWLVDGGTTTLATGGASVATLATLRGALHPERSFADEPTLSRSLAAVGDSTSALLVVQPLRFDSKRANLPAAPLVIALGRKEKNATLRIDVAHGLLRELARWQMGL